MPDYREGCYRLFEGFVYLFAVAGFAGLAIGAIEYAEFGIISSGGLAIILLLTLVAKPVAGFAFLFTTFYGYSRMAEGSALLLGFEVPQNFNKPHLARDLGDFWKRWHRSVMYGSACALDLLWSLRGDRGTLRSLLSATSRN